MITCNYNMIELIKFLNCVSLSLFFFSFFFLLSVSSRQARPFFSCYFTFEHCFGDLVWLFTPTFYVIYISVTYYCKTLIVYRQPDESLAIRMIHEEILCSWKCQLWLNHDKNPDTKRGCGDWMSKVSLLHLGTMMWCKR